MTALTNGNFDRVIELDAGLLTAIARATTPLGQALVLEAGTDLGGRVVADAEMVCDAADGRGLGQRNVLERANRLVAEVDGEGGVGMEIDGAPGFTDLTRDL